MASKRRSRKRRPITTREASPRRYYVKDHLGSIRAVVDATGEVQETYDY